MLVRFNFKPLAQLETAITDLVSAADVVELSKNNEIRAAQINKLNDFAIKLKLMAKGSALDVDAENASRVLEYYKRIEELKSLSTELTEEQLAERKELEFKKMAVFNLSKIKEIKKPLTDEEIETEKETLESKVMTDEQRSLILTGMLLSFKSEIENELAGGYNYFTFNSAYYDKFYQKIDATVGVTNVNILDEKSKMAALAAYNQFFNLMNKIQQFNKDNLKKVESVVKQARLVTQDSVSPYQLIAPSPYISAPSKAGSSVADADLEEERKAKEISIGSYAKMQTLLKVDLPQFTRNKKGKKTSLSTSANNETDLGIDKDSELHSTVQEKNRMIDLNIERVKVLDFFSNNLKPQIDGLRNDEVIAKPSSIRKMK